MKFHPEGLSGHTGALSLRGRIMLNRFQERHTWNFQRLKRLYIFLLNISSRASENAVTRLNSGHTASQARELAVLPGMTQLSGHTLGSGSVSRFCLATSLLLYPDRELGPSHQFLQWFRSWHSPGNYTDL